MGASRYGGGGTVESKSTLGDGNYSQWDPANAWKPLMVKFVLEDFNSKKHQVVLVLLPSGVCNNTSSDGIKVAIDNGDLVASCAWPE